jgi:hypothetical protein
MQTNLKAQSDENLRMFHKPRTISERLAEAAKTTFVGRKGGNHYESSSNDAVSRTS